MTQVGETGASLVVLARNTFDWPIQGSTYLTDHLAREGGENQIGMDRRIRTCEHQVRWRSENCLPGAEH